MRSAYFFGLAVLLLLPVAIEAQAYVAVTPPNAVVDAGQTVALYAAVHNGTGAYAYQWYNATGGSDVEIAGANSYALNITAESAGQRLMYFAMANSTRAAGNSTGNALLQSNYANITVDPALSIATDYYPPVVNITTPHSFTFNALYNIVVAGGTGNYSYSWNTSGLPYNAFIANSSCSSTGPLCIITAGNVTGSVSGTLTVSVYDSSAGNASYANTQYYLLTANPDPPLVSDYLDRNVSQLLRNPLRIGLITPGAAQIVYSLGLGNYTVAATAATEQVLRGFGARLPSTAADIGLNFDYYLPDYFEELVNTTADYVPIDAGAFEGTLTAGLQDFQAGGVNSVVIGGDFDKNISGVRSDIMLVANTTNSTPQGLEVTDAMGRILSGVNSRVYGVNTPTVAMIIWYGYGSMYADGSKSFIGSEIEEANGNNIFPGYYPSPSVEQLIAGNPDYIIASIFGTPYSNISTTYNQLATMPGIQNTTAWKDGRVYVLGNLATNITDEPGPLAAYGTLLYAIILHPQQFGYTNSSVPNNITSQWVEQNVMPSLSFLPTVQIAAQGSQQVDVGQNLSYEATISQGNGVGPFELQLVANGNVVANATVMHSGDSAYVSYAPQTPGRQAVYVRATDTGSGNYTFDSSRQNATVSQPTTSSSTATTTVGTSAGYGIRGSGGSSVQSTSVTTVAQQIVTQKNVPASSTTYDTVMPTTSPTTSVQRETTQITTAETTIPRQSVTQVKSSVISKQQSPYTLPAGIAGVVIAIAVGYAFFRLRK